MKVPDASKIDRSPQSDSPTHTRNRDLWSRRAFLSGTALTVAGLASRPAPVLGFDGEGMGYGRRPDLPRFSLNLTETTGADLRVLTCAPAWVDMGDGRSRRVLAYNGLFPGPTWEARTGDVIGVELVNNLDEETITHWHGLIVDYANDGGPRLGIAPGVSYNYRFPITQRAGLNFYHPHPHMLTGKQVCLGLAGAFIVRDAEEDALQLPSGPYEVPLLIRDAS